MYGCVCVCGGGVFALPGETTDDEDDGEDRTSVVDRPVLHSPVGLPVPI